MYFDGQSLRIEFGVTRLDDVKPNTPITGRRFPAQRMVLTRGTAPEGWTAVADITAPQAFGDVQYLFVEGGAQAAAAFIAADMVDRLLIYRAPIIVGAGLPCIGDIGLGSLADAHGRWRNFYAPHRNDCFAGFRTCAVSR